MTDVIKNKYEHCCVSHKHPQMDDINQAEQMTFPKRLVNKNIQQNILIRLTTEAMVSPVKTSHLSVCTTHSSNNEVAREDPPHA